MEIPEIKSNLTLAEVIKHYGYKADKHNRINCPFHDDKTPSMQLYWKTHTAYCFSSNCKTHGKSLDVIDFILHQENCTKAEAIQKAKAMINGNAPQSNNTAQSREQFLQKMFTYFCNAVHNSPPAKEYLSLRNLDYTILASGGSPVGYNSGQFHHGARKDEQLIKQCLEYGLLLDKGLISRTGEKAYVPFGKNGIVFALRNQKKEITGLYFRSTVNDKEQRHYYLKDRKGLYPEYPKAETKKLIIAESIIDTATLLQLPEITSQYSLLALYGTNGLTEEHIKAIKDLQQLEEIIFFLNGDEPGRTAVKKHSATLQQLKPLAKIYNVEPPETEDINSLAQGHQTEIFTELINKKTFLFSIEKPSTEIKKEAEKPVKLTITEHTEKKEIQQQPGKLNAENPHNLYYKGKAADYYIKGGIRCPLDALKISVQIVNPDTRADYRSKVDLYEYKQVESLIKSTSAKLEIIPELLEKDLSQLTELLEAHRTQTLKERGSRNQKPVVKMPEATINQCLDFWKAPHLIKRINELIGKAGVTGEETNRIFLFAIASSYKMPDTLHALIQGSSGSGKTRLLKIICELMPQEDTIKFTRVTDSSFYNYREDYLVNKLLGFEDIDGLKEDALYAVRELISNEILISSTSAKTEDGQIVAMERIVRGPIASISCTTKGQIYEDNMSRVFLIAVDESKEQTKRIIHYQQQKAAGLIDGKQEKEVREFLQNCIRLLKPCEVINPYADKIHLPQEADQIRRLNDLYLSLVKQITLLHQYQRKKDRQGRLITTKEDLRAANEIMFESIILKVDELDGSLRQFFEAMKKYAKSSSQELILREVRQSLNMSKTRLHRYINDLVQLEYIQQTGGYANKGYRYKITYWDDIEALRAKIKKQLDGQIDDLPKDNY